MTDDLTFAALSERMDKQAAAIKRLRADRDALVARVTELETLLSGATPPVLAPSTGSPSTFTLPSECAMCGAHKGARQTLTCAACSAKRHKIIKTPGSDRTSITRSDCFICAEPFKPATRFLCTSCSAAFKVWKASQ